MSLITHSDFSEKHFRGVATDASPWWAWILHDDCSWHRIALPRRGMSQRDLRRYWKVLLSTLSSHTKGF